MSKPVRMAVFLSGSGTNAEKIFSHFKGHPTIEVALVLSNNPTAFGLARAAKYHIPTLTFNKQQFRETEEVLTWLIDAGITHVVLAGFLWLIPQNLIAKYPHRIVNIHPALLPKFGGKGMYGAKVHEAVKAAGEMQTGITIHEVDERYDEGKILFQAICNLSPSDTTQEIAEKVQQLEHAHYPQIIEKWVTA